MTTNTESVFSDWMRSIQTRMEAALARRLPAETTIPAHLHQAMRYASLNGGKRVRPLLAFAAGEATGADPVRLEAVACAVELIHAYSLVHDDLPCMDDDVLRRGQPTCHIEYDEPTALLVGDALQAQAFEILAASDLGGGKAQIEMIRLLAHAAGSCGMCGGQAIDLAAVGNNLDQPQLELMHILKTGALIRASVLLGALCGELSEAEKDSLDHFAKTAGLLFQVVDDILDCTASTATLGKTAGKDAAHEKPTYVSLLGLDAARAHADALAESAKAALQPFGKRAARLGSLTDFLIHRSF